MKKLLLVAVSAMFSSAAFSQMMVNGGDFVNHPERYDNKPVTIKNVSVSTGDGHEGGHHGAPGAHHAAPGPQGGHQAPCVAPRGTEQINVTFKEKMDYQGCFYAQTPMATTIKNQTRGGHPVEAILSIKGNSKTGYLITNFKQGR